MEKKNNLALPSPLESVRYQFETWRETRKTPREPIPDYLWKAASKLQNEYPISRISKALRLNHTDLKNRISGRKSKRKKKQQTSPLFVELDCLDPFASSECIVEMEDGCGSKMRMIFRGKAELDLLELGKTFWTKGK